MHNVSARRPSRVCFDDVTRTSSSSSSLVAAAHNPSSPSVPWSSAVSVSRVTPVDAQPSCAQQLAGILHGGRVPAAVDSCAPQVNGVLPGGRVPSEAAADGDSGDAAAGGDASAVVHPYLMELIQNTVRDEVEEARESLHRDIFHMHMQMAVNLHHRQVSITV